MYESHKAELIPAIVAVGAIATVVVALRRGVYPGFWISRSSQPVQFWVYTVLTLAAATGCLAWVAVGWFG